MQSEAKRYLESRMLGNLHVRFGVGAGVKTPGLHHHYVLKCFVLIDLKMYDLAHQDLGQMQMYVNYYTREMMNEGDNPPIGIILCADKSEAVVRYTLAEDNRQIFASKYKLYLPTEQELKNELYLAIGMEREA